MGIVSRNCGAGALGVFFLSALSLSGCARAADPEPILPGQKPAESAPKQDSPSAAELEALGLKFFGPHEHTGEHLGPHYEIVSVSVDIGKRNVTDEELEQKRKGPHVVGVEVSEEDGVTPLGDKYHTRFIVVKRIKDRWAEQDEQAWKQAMAEKYLILADIGKSKWFRPVALANRGWGGNMHFIKIGTMYQAPDKSSFYVSVYVCDKPDAGFDHDFTRWVLTQGGGKTRSLGKHYVFEHNEGGGEDGAIWKASDTMFISIANAGQYPKEVIEAYLEKYPSVLTADYRIDYAKWAAEEMAFRLERMDKALEAGPESYKKTGISFCDEWRTVRTYFPFDKGKCDDKDVEGCREVKKLIEKWWAANKDKLRWNAKTRKFETADQ